MSERTFRINIKSIADTGALELTAKETAKLTSFIQRLDQEYEQLNAQLASGHTEKAAATMGSLGNQSQAADRAVAGAGKSSGNASLAVLELSRALEDAQYGIRGVLNNIPGLIAMLGGGAGLAGVVSIAAVVITQLWEKFSDSAKAEEDLKAVAKAAEELQARLDSLSEVTMEKFGAALDVQRDKLAAFLGEWQDATKNLGESYNALDEQVQTRLDNDLAKLEVQKEAALAGAETPEERKAIEEDFGGRAESLKGAAKQESAGLKVDAARQQEEEAALGIKRADEAQKQAAEQVKQSQEAARAAERNILNAGVESDQERAVSAFEKEKEMYKVYRDKGDEEAQAEALKRMQNLGPAAQAAREEMDAGVRTYDQAKADEKLTPQQKKSLNDELMKREAAVKAEAAGRENFTKAEETGAAAREAFGEAKRTTGNALDRLNTEELRGEAARMKAGREAGGGVDAGKLNGAADAATSAAEDVGKSAEKLATSTADSSSRIAGDLRQLTQVMSSSMSSIQAAVADNSRAIAAVAQRTDAASQMAAAALAAVNDNRAGARINNRR